MKIAILISGEYRTFPICRKTMTFLDDPRVDVYFSTWNKSIIKNERLGLDINDTITEEKVRADLGREAVVLVEPVECFEEKLYNSKMVHRWCTGFELIRSSGTQYDYVMVMRPDLFFNVDNNFDLNSVFEIKDELRMAWFDGNTEFLQDNFYAASWAKMDEMFSKLSVNVWADQIIELDWHKWWSSFVKQTFAEVKQLSTWEAFIFCRGLVKDGYTFAAAHEAEQIWRDAGIVNFLEMGGSREGTVAAWSESVVATAEARRDSGFFDKFKKRIAVLISGEYRTFDQCRKTMKFIDDPNVDVYFSTWSTSHIKNERLGIDQFEEITEERIARVLYPKVAKKILIEKTSEIAAEKTPAAMVFLQGVGVNFIEASDIQYSHIAISRPDLYFAKEFDIHEIKRAVVPGHHNASWTYPEDRKLGDIFCISESEVIYRIFRSIFSDWRNAEPMYWHSWFYEYVSAKEKISSLKEDFQHIVLCRYITNNCMSISDAIKTSNMWRESQLIDAAHFASNAAKLSDIWNIKVPHLLPPKKRLAVLISGEYRTFRECRKTMRFLDDPNVDVYFSTWSTSHIKNERLGIDVFEEITAARISKDLGFAPKAISIESSSEIPNNLKYSSPMLHRMHVGIKLIKASSTTYDRILITRPDLFFDINSLPIPPLEEMLSHLHSDNFYSAWSNELEKNTLGDFLLVANPKVMFNIFALNPTIDWNSDPSEDLHEWWFRFVTGKINSVRKVPPYLDSFALYRYISDNEISTADALTKSKIWEDAKQMSVLGFSEKWKIDGWKI